MADVSLGSLSSVLVVSFQGSKYTASACSVPYCSAHFMSHHWWVGWGCRGRRQGGGGLGGTKKCWSTSLSVQSVLVVAFQAKLLDSIRCCSSVLHS